MNRWPKSASVVLAFAVGVACSKKGDTDGSGATAVPGESSGGAATGGGEARPVPQAPSRGPEHAVFSLVDNRLAGHAQRGGGLVLLAGSAGFAKYLRFGRANPPWHMRRDVDGVKAAEMKSKVAGVHVPLGAEQAAGAPAIRVRARSSAPQRLGLRLNGKRDKEVTVELAAGWSTAELAAPPDTLVAGENEILLFAGKSPIAVAWIQVGGQAFGEETPVVYDGAAKSLLLPGAGGMAWYVTVPDKGLVTGDLDDGACKVAVRATAEEGGVVDGVLVGRGAAVDLGKLGGKVARLELTASGCPAGKPARLSKAALVVPGAAPEVARASRPKNVVLWIMDSLRADRVSTVVEGARPEVPEFEKLAATGATFTQAYMQGNETKCSHASIWTSLYPVNHKMIPPNSRLDHKWVTVDEVAKSAGLATSGVSANGYITPDRGFGQKWDKYRNHIHQGGGLRAEDVLGKAIESLAEPTSPWLLYVGTIDTHVSWRAKEPWFSKYDPAPYSGRFKVEASGQDMGKAAAGKLVLDDRDIERINALYDSNVSYQDSQVGALFAKLTEWGVANDTMVVITADHGDELFEVGRVGHGGSSLDSVVHVPLVIHYPPLFPAGKVPEGAEGVDIVPTIADALGVTPDQAWQGESLIPLAQGVGRGYPRLSMSSKYENGHAARMGRWKVYAAGGSKAALFDVVGEPAEKSDRARERPMALRHVADALWMLRAYNAEWKKSRWGNAANVSAAFAADMGE